MEKILKNIIENINEEINITTIYLQRETRRDTKKYKKGIIDGLRIAKTIIMIERILNEE